jgi:hypothetical protein
MILRFKLTALYQEIYQKLLSAIYRMQLSSAGGDKVMPSGVDKGFYDDFPARFDEIIANLKVS